MTEMVKKLSALLLALIMTVCGWLEENGWKYGFILRYPPGKGNITGINYEPWHFRYVGKEAAEYIYANGITPEEYLSGRFEA